MWFRSKIEEAKRFAPILAKKTKIQVKHNGYVTQRQYNKSKH